MSHILQHTHRFAAGKFTASATPRWLLITMLALAITVGITSLNQPSEQVLPAPSVSSSVTEAKLLEVDLAPVRAPTEPALREEDLDMTSLRPHGG